MAGGVPLTDEQLGRLSSGLPDIDVPRYGDYCGPGWTDGLEGSVAQIG